MKEWVYMHTIDGQPACYIPGEQIVFGHGKKGNAGVTTLCKDVNQIKRERRLSVKWLLKNNYPLEFDYGYIRILKSAISGL
jgi:hypothetical protein